MTYTKSQLNRDFLFKVYGTENGAKVNSLRGVDGLIEMIGEKLFTTFVERAYRSGQDKTVCKLRRGLVVTLYYH